MKQKHRNIPQFDEDDLPLEERATLYLKKLADQKEIENFLRAIELFHRYDISNEERRFLMKKFPGLNDNLKQ